MMWMVEGIPDIFSAQQQLKVKAFKSMCAKCGISGIYLCKDNKNLYQETFDSSANRKQCGPGNVIATYEISIDDFLACLSFKDASILFNGCKLSTPYANAFNIKSICFPHFLYCCDVNSYARHLHMSPNIISSICSTNLLSADAWLADKYTTWHIGLTNLVNPTPIAILNRRHDNKNKYSLLRDETNFIKIESDNDIAMFVDFLYIHFYVGYDSIVIGHETSLSFAFTTLNDIMPPFNHISNELAPYLSQTVDGRKIFPNVHDRVLWKNSTQSFEEMLINFDLMYA